MPPRRRTIPVRPQNAQELVEAIEQRVPTTVITTGINPIGGLGSPFREIIFTAVNAFTGATGEGQRYHTLTPDFKLIEKAEDFHRIVNAINQAHERERFR
jgi:hypothetical protein